MNKGDKSIRIVFAGGGTGGHIYPGIAVADELQLLAVEKNIPIEIYWIGSKTGMDKTIVEKNLVSSGGSITQFYGISCGKLRRYLSLKNIVDIFKIIAGYFGAIHILRKIKPTVLFSKGGFVSVPPCAAAKLLHIPYYTHECDFTPGLATRLNSKGAKNIFVSYEETIKYIKETLRQKCIVTGNPVRPIFYDDNADKGRKFLSIENDQKKPLLLVLGGSLGARQINSLVVENLPWLKERFVVIHQTGKLFADENPDVMNSGDDSYKPYAFIYSEMPYVIQCADVILSRAGANSLWECAVCKKPMLLIPLCGSGTRGDQVDNARFFEKQNAALVLTGQEVTSEALKDKLTELLSEQKRKQLTDACKKIILDQKPAYAIAKIILDGVVE
jgi:UDP-N-acetylglucosamine--N-acetylmuramyl-(pentapeptide) pyrophosphoryl-undecaprenol N-acetylglucosamine transferase